MGFPDWEDMAGKERRRKKSKKSKERRKDGILRQSPANSRTAHPSPFPLLGLRRPPSVIPRPHTDTHVPPTPRPLLLVSPAPESFLQPTSHGNTTAMTTHPTSHLSASFTL